MFRSVFVLLFSAGWALIAGVAGSAILYKEEYGRIVSYSSYVTFISIFLLLGVPGYVLAHLDRFSKDELFYLRLPVIAAVAAIACFVLYDHSLIAIAYSALTLLTVLSSQRALKAQVQQWHLACTLYQAIPSFSKSFALSLAVSSHLIFPHYVGKSHLFIFFNAVLLTASIGLSWYLAPRGLTGPIREKDISGRRKIQQMYLQESGLAFWISPVLALGYSVAVAPIVANKHGFILAAYVGIYLIFWSINSIFLTAIFNNYFSARFARARGLASGLSAVVKRIFIFSFFIGVVSVLVAYVGAYIGVATIWRHYENLGPFLYLSAAGFFLRSFSAAFGILTSFPPLVKLKAFVQMLALALVLIRVNFSDEMNVQDLAVLLLEVEIVILTGYALIVVGAKSFGLSWYKSFVGGANE
jgi:hypothetical protein